MLTVAGNSVTITRWCRPDVAHAEYVDNYTPHMVISVGDMGIGVLIPSHYTIDGWNLIPYEDGARGGDPLVAYKIGKKFAELEAWDDVDPTEVFTAVAAETFGVVVRLDVGKRSFSRSFSQAIPATPPTREIH